jgi:hypothetical protein
VNVYRGARIGAIATSLILVAACGASTPTSDSPSPSLGPTTSIGATATVSPSPAPSTSPSPLAAIGTSWIRVDDPDVTPRAGQGSMTGVISGGPGAIAWGEIFGAGPLIWTTVDGQQWSAAKVDRPTDADPAQEAPGAVLDVTPFGAGYVAVGSYAKRDELTSLVWTSLDGTDWRLAPEDPDLDHALIGQDLVVRDGRLLAFGCQLASATDCGATVIWVSPDGVTWTEIEPVLPAEVAGLAYDDASSDRLWARGPAATDELWPLVTEDTPRPSRLSSIDGRTWRVESLPILGIERLHTLPAGLFLTVQALSHGPETEPHPSWMTVEPGVHRSTDAATWQPLVLGRQLGEEIVSVGDTMIMVGSAHPCAEIDSWCNAGAWRSTDAGASWDAVPVTPNPAGVTRARLLRVAALTDGTLVGVGDEIDDHGWPTPAVWVSPPASG